MSDSSMEVFWKTNEKAVAYDVYNVSIGEQDFMTTVIGKSKSSVTIEDLKPNWNYTLRVRMRDSRGSNDCNEKSIKTTTKDTPNPPTSLALNDEALKNNNLNNVTVRISGQLKGNTIKLFTDNACTQQSSEKPATENVIDLTSSDLTSGKFTFYANSTNAKGNTSACSTTFVSYNKRACPENYLYVKADDEKYRKKYFCVSKYEMKKEGTVAVSKASELPWVQISFNDAKSACVANGQNYDLISGDEWSLIAREIERNPANWSLKKMWEGTISRGHTDGKPGKILIANEKDSESYFGTENTETQKYKEGNEQKRTQYLADGEIIWDFAGNVWEWTNINVGEDKKPTILNQQPSKEGESEWIELNQLNKNMDIGFPLESSKWRSSNLKLTSNEGIGKYLSKSEKTETIPVRGGGFDSNENAGIYSLKYAFMGAENPAIGFRCVFVP